MTSVDLNTIQFYQPPTKGGRPGERRPTRSNGDIHIVGGNGNTPTALGRNNESSGVFRDVDPIKTIDLTVFPAIEYLSPPKDTEADVRDTLNASNGPCNIRDHDHSDGIDQSYFPSIEDFESHDTPLSETEDPRSFRLKGKNDQDLPGDEFPDVDDWLRSPRSLTALSASVQPEASGQSQLESEPTQSATSQSPSSRTGKTTHPTNMEPTAATATGGIRESSKRKPPGNQASASSTSSGGNLTREKQAVPSDNSIVIHDTDEDDTDTDGLTALLKNPTFAPEFRYPPGRAPEDKNNSASSNRNESVGNPGNPIGVQDQDTDTSDDGTSEKQDEEQGSPSTPPTSVAGSEAGCSTLHEKHGHSTSDTPPRRNTLLLSTSGKQTCESNDGGRKDLEPGCSAGENREDGWDGEEVEADEEGKEDLEEEKPNGDGDEKHTPLLRSMKKRSRPAAGEKLPAKRDTKRRRFSSPLSSNEETETGDESDISSYAPSKPHHISNPRPTPSHSIDLEADTSDDGAMESTGGRPDRRLPSRMTVIYERQSWKGRIVGERDAKQGRGRPRKQYLVRWEQSWVDGARLTAPELLHSWREKKASRSRR